MSAVTRAGAACTVRVVYASGYAAESRSLRQAQTVGSSGTVSWTWTPDTSRPGMASATVTCALGGKSAQGTASFGVA